VITRGETSASAIRELRSSQVWIVVHPEKRSTNLAVGTGRIPPLCHWSGAMSVGLEVSGCRARPQVPATRLLQCLAMAISWLSVSA
jgi:hypothetical protein